MQPTSRPDPEAQVLGKALLHLNAVSGSLADIQRIIRELFDDLMVAGAKVGEGGVDVLNTWDRGVWDIGEYGDFSEALLDEAYEYSCTQEFNVFLSGVRAGEYFDVYHTAVHDLEGLKTKMSLMQYMRYFEYVAQTVTFLMQKFRTDQGNLSCGIASGNLVNRGKSRREKHLHGLIARIIHELYVGIQLIPKILDHTESTLLTDDTRVRYTQFLNGYKQELEYFWGIYPTNRVSPFAGESRRQQVQMLHKKIITYHDERGALLQSFFLSQTEQQRLEIRGKIQQCEKNLYMARSELESFCKNHNLENPFAPCTDDIHESPVERAIYWEISHRQDQALEDFSPSPVEIKLMSFLGEDFRKREHIFFHFSFTERDFAESFEEKILQEDIRALQSRQCERKMLIYFRIFSLLIDAQHGRVNLSGKQISDMQNPLTSLGNEIEDLLVYIRSGGDLHQSPNTDEEEPCPPVCSYLLSELEDTLISLTNIGENLGEKDNIKLGNVVDRLLIYCGQIMEYMRTVQSDQDLSDTEKSQYIGEYFEDLIVYCDDLEDDLQQGSIDDAPEIDQIFGLLEKIKNLVK